MLAADGAAADLLPVVRLAGGGTVRRKQQRFKLRTDGKRYRYYLVWITKLPPDQERVEISDVTLFRNTRT